MRYLVLTLQAGSTNDPVHVIGAERGRHLRECERLHSLFCSVETLHEYKL